MKINGYDVYYKPSEAWEIAKSSKDVTVLACNDNWTKVVAWNDRKNGEIELHFDFGKMDNLVHMATVKNAEDCEHAVRIMYQSLFSYAE